MSRKPRADDATVMEFIRLIWPDSTEASMAMFTEEKLLRDAITEVTRLRRQIAILLPAANEALKPLGEHRLIEGYCPDCGGSCLIGFGNP